MGQALRWCSMSFPCLWLNLSTSYSRLNLFISTVTKAFFFFFRNGLYLFLQFDQKKKSQTVMVSKHKTDTHTQIHAWIHVHIPQGWITRARAASGMIPSHPQVPCSPWWKLQVDVTLRAQPVHPLIQGTETGQRSSGQPLQNGVTQALVPSQLPEDCLHLPTTRDKRGVGEEAGRQTDRQLPSKRPQNSWSRRRLCLAVAWVQAGKAFQTTGVLLPPQPGRILSVSSGFQDK